MSWPRRITTTTSLAKRVRPLDKAEAYAVAQARHCGQVINHKSEGHTMLQILTIAQPYLRQLRCRWQRATTERLLHWLGASRTEIINIRKRKLILKG